MTRASQYDADMPDSMEMITRFIQFPEDRANHVEHPSDEEPDKSEDGNQLNDQFVLENRKPAQQDIKHQVHMGNAMSQPDLREKTEQSNCPNN